MKKQLFVLGMTSVFALTGCHGTKKVSFSEFQSKVNEWVEKNKDSGDSVSQVRIKGTYGGEKVSFKVPIPKTAEDAAKLATKYTAVELATYTFVMTNATPVSFAQVELSGYEYFVGFGYKVKSEKETFEWASYGIMASYIAENSKLSVSWRK